MFHFLTRDIHAVVERAQGWVRLIHFAASFARQCFMYLGRLTFVPV
jgi:hypothetical protein